MKTFNLKLSARIKRTADIESFRFIPESKISFLPGQFARIILDSDNHHDKSLIKYLSFSGSPLNSYLEFTKRISRSDFSKKLTSLKTGDEITFQGPLGNCVFKERYEEVVFLAGGIGITPVISMIEYIAQKGLNTRIKLFYSNHRRDDIAFQGALDGWQSANKNIEIFYLVSENKPEDKRYILGRINKEILENNVQDINQQIFYAFGPPKMVEAMKSLCLDMNCSPDQLIAESFLGY